MVGRGCWCHCREKNSFRKYLVRLVRVGDKEVVKDNAAGVGVGLRAVVVDKAEDLRHDEDGVHMLCGGACHRGA